MTAFATVNFYESTGERCGTENYSFEVHEMNMNLYFHLREELKRVFKNVHKGADILVTKYSDNVPSIPFTILASER